jgi:phytoene synthase
VIDVDPAYRYCERVTRQRAGNFFYGIRLLPPEKRRAMCAVYAFARLVDDIGDGTLPPERKLAELDAVGGQLERLESPNGSPVAVALADARARFDLPVDALRELVDGVRMDVTPRSYASFDDLVAYCRLVAGSIGRLCVAIFGARDRDAGMRLADDLGVAMQITNVLRDVREDDARGRLYLPREDIERFGCSGFPAAPPAQAARLITFEAARAKDWVARGLELVPLLDRRSSSCVLAMTGIYRRLLERILEDPAIVLERRVSLPVWEKAWVAARSLVEASP